MDIKLNEEQIQLRNSARTFMEAECTPQFVRQMEESELGYSRKMWRQMAEMGWLGIALPESCGGLGLSTVDLVLLTKELGRCICPSPFLSTSIIAGEAIARAGNAGAAQRRFLLWQGLQMSTANLALPIYDQIVDPADYAPPAFRHLDL